MSPENPNELAGVVGRFETGGRLVSVEPLGSGHIHDTYVSHVSTRAGSVRRFVHQRINRSIFASPERLMHNIERVTAHLRGKLVARGEDARRRSLTIVPTVDGRSFLRTPAGECWRTYLFIEGARTHDVAPGPRQVYSAAHAFAEFEQMLSDLPRPRLEETIPHFGNTRRRFEALVDAVQSDACNRAAVVTREIAFAMDREGLGSLLVDLLGQGRIPERIAHYDTKLNNVLIDERTGEGICVLDLDTVMHGTVLYDFGDSVRLGAARGVEGARDPADAGLSLELFDRLAAGYLEVAAGFLTPAEIEHLVPACPAVAFTIGVRFLTDYLDGDVYFKTREPRDNLDRCRTQFAMVRDMERNAAAMRAVIERYLTRKR